MGALTARAADRGRRSLRHTKAVLPVALRNAKAHDITSLAAGVAFKMFLSIFPSLIAAVAAFSLVTSPIDLARLIDSVPPGLLPEGSVDLVREPLRDLVSTGRGTAGGLALAGVLGGLWAASSAAVTLMRALNRIHDVVETRNLVLQRLVALALVLALFVALFALVVLLVVGPQLQEALLSGVGAAGVGLQWVASAARFAGAAAVLVVLFAFVYWWAPDHARTRPFWASSGALIGVVGWLVLSWAFSLYTRGSYSAPFGAPAGVIVTLLWLQLSMVVLLLGAEVNVEMERRRIRRRALAAGAGFTSGAVGPTVPSGDEAPAGRRRR
ncbi:MAG: YihY/virulence factor BrkB family protein [Actinomycetota bacterium]|nr:YihY/virulence factor BrkB family protein [Actinomycetota bacterium]